MQCIRFLLLILSLLPVIPAAAASGSYDKPLAKAYALLAAQDYAHAYSAFQRYGDHNPLAQFSLGLFHQNGWGRPVNADLACSWFIKAAKGKIPTALHYAGDCLMRQPDAPGHATAALADYLAAADNGHLISLCSAAEFYIRGRYVARDVAQGLALCTRAALANSPPAMLRLATYLHHDADVPSDLAAARRWYQLAAARQQTEARYQLAIMQSQGDGGPVEVEAAMVAMESLASDGYLPAYLPTAVLYAHLPPDDDTGLASPAQLAKVYLWSSAAKARLAQPAQQAQADQLLTAVLAAMPAEWRPELDRKVAAHLAKFAVPRTAAAPGA